jgi:hypothetical protein
MELIICIPAAVQRVYAQRLRVALASHMVLLRVNETCVPKNYPVDRWWVVA